LDGTPSASGTYTVSISVVAEVIYMMQTIALPSYDVDYQLVINPSGGGCPTPTCSFTASVNNLLSDFTDGSTVTGATIYSWNFDDGTYSTEQNPSHAYTTAGTYNVCLAVNDSCGSASTCQAVTVTDPGTGCANPVAAFTSSVVGLQVTYANASTTTGSVNYLWDFDDGITSTEANPMHAFPTDGTYNVCLAVTDSCGVDSVCESVTVAALPLGLEDISLNDFVLIPNPTNGVVKLAGSKGELSIYDIYGKQIIEKTSDRILDISEFKSGIYWVNLIDQNGKLHIQKLIKQ
jgi:PKD repeat protein